MTCQKAIDILALSPRTHRYFSEPLSLLALKVFICCDDRRQYNLSLGFKHRSNMRSSFDLSNIQRIQASLPVREGGLGFRVCNRLNFTPFFASAASTLSLQDDVLTECAQIPIRATFLLSYLAVWSTKVGDVRDTLPTKSHSGITVVCWMSRLT